MMKSLLATGGTVLLCLAAGVCRAGEEFPPEFEQVPAGRFLASQNEFFGSLKTAAKQLVLFERKNRTPQHFCAIGYRLADGHVNVWVHWKEDQRLLLWRGSSDPEMREKGLVYTNRNLKLGRDTVERSEDIQGSTYKETRSWWEAVAMDCDVHGEKVVIAP